MYQHCVIFSIPEKSFDARDIGPVLQRETKRFNSLMAEDGCGGPALTKELLENGGVLTHLS